MNNRDWLVRFSVSLYVLFFAIAFWSTLPSSVTGSMGGTSSLVEAQLATCGLQTDTTADVSGFPPNTEVQGFAAETYIGLIFPGNEAVYQCALQTGALFN
ncbi:MAG: hypothetical protein ACLQPD_28300 [Desulfomonilaceae bacterium]